MRPVNLDVLQPGNVVATALAESLDKPFPWAVGFLYGSTELSLELWTTIVDISEFDDSGFDDLPEWIQIELQARRLSFERREPTELEKWETVKDAREHRIMNKELTINDYLDKYKRGKSLTLIT